MLFNSFQYLLFLTVLFFVYFALPHRWRWVLLLLGSYYFYMCWRMEYILLILLSTFIDYVAGLGIESARSRTAKRLWLASSLTTNLGLLFTFKYYNFFAESARAAFQHFNICAHIPALNVLLPVGISFYTFQTLSYTLDVYMGSRTAERNAGIFALYVAFFPQLVAGPIERSTHLMPQFRKVVRFDYDRTTSGLRLILWGLVKKMVVADRLAHVANQAYLHPAASSPLALTVGTICFAFQIYCDFSAYSDIAIGSARILGFDLMQNFRQPYLSKSIAEFWRRWHISLSTWFRDYVYIPLGGNRRGEFQNLVNLAIVFLLSGLWHGANWTFVVWGGLHAFYMVAERLFSRDGRKPLASGRLATAGRTFLTFMLVCYAWIYFRASTLADAFLISRKIFVGLLHPLRDMVHPLAGISSEARLSLALIFALMAIETLQQRVDVAGRFSKLPLPARWAIYYIGVLSILLLGVIENDAFIYFQF